MLSRTPSLKEKYSEMGFIETFQRACIGSYSCKTHGSCVCHERELSKGGWPWLLGGMNQQSGHWKTTAWFPLEVLQKYRSSGVKCSTHISNVSLAVYKRFPQVVLPEVEETLKQNDSETAFWKVERFFRHLVNSENRCKTQVRWFFVSFPLSLPRLWCQMDKKQLEKGGDDGEK